jgi:hypothetical protein
MTHAHQSFLAHAQLDQLLGNRAMPRPQYSKKFDNRLSMSSPTVHGSVTFCIVGGDNLDQHC